MTAIFQTERLPSWVAYLASLASRIADEFYETFKDAPDGR